jgi:tetratricopeptide (TPR) repeat protein
LSKSLKLRQCDSTLLMKKLILTFFIAFATSFLYAQDNVDEALAYQYYQQADYEKAAVLFEKIFNKTKNDGYFDLYFNSLIKIKKYAEAEVTLKKLIRQYPDKTSYAIALGRVYQENGKTAEANKIYQEAISNTPKDENKFRELANNFYRFEAYEMAITAFQQGGKYFQMNKCLLTNSLAFIALKKIR